MSNTENQLFWSYAAVLASGKRVLVVNPTLENLNLLLGSEVPPLELVYISETDYQLENTKYRRDANERKISKDLIIDQNADLETQEIDRLLKKNSFYFTEKSDQSYPAEYEVLPLLVSVGQFLFLDANGTGLFEHLDSQLTDDAQKQQFGVIVSNSKGAKLQNFASIQNLDAKIDSVYVASLQEELDQLKDKLKSANQKKKADPALVQITQERDELKVNVEKTFEEIKALNEMIVKYNEEKPVFAAQIAELQAQNSSLESQLSNAIKLQKTYQSQGDQLRNENKKQQQEHQSLKASFDDRENQLNDQIKALTAQLAQAQQDAQAQADQSKADAIVLQSQYDAIVLQNQELKQEVEREKLIAQKENIILKAELEKFSKQDQQIAQLNQQILQTQEAYDVVSASFKQWLQSNTSFPLPSAPYADKHLAQQWCQQLVQYQPTLKGNLEAVQEIEQLKASIAQLKLELQASKQQREQDSKAFTHWRKNSSTKTQELLLQQKLEAESRLRETLELELKEHEEIFTAYENEIQRLELALTQALEPKELKLSKENPVLLKVDLLNTKEQLLALENVLKLNQNSQNQLNAALLEKVTELSKLNRNKQKLEEELKLLKIDFERLSKNQPVIGVYQHIYGSLQALSPQRAKDLYPSSASSVSSSTPEKAEDTTEADHENMKFLLKQKIKAVRQSENQQSSNQSAGQSADQSVDQSVERIEKQKEKLLKQVQSFEQITETVIASPVVTAEVSSENAQDSGEKSKMEKLMEKLKQIKNN